MTENNKLYANLDKEVDTIKNRNQIEEVHYKIINGEIRNIFSNFSFFPETEKYLLTERKIAERKHLESEKRFRETAELMPGVIFELDLNFRITYMNKSGTDLFGYSQDKLDKGVSIFSVIPKEEHNRFKKDIKNIFSFKQISSQEYKMFKSDRTPIYLLIKSAPILIDNNIIGIRVCLVDITERKNVEEKLRYSERKFRTIFQKSPIGMAIFSSNGRLIDSNKSFLDMFGLQKTLRYEHQNINMFTIFKFSSDKIQYLKFMDVFHCEIEFYQQKEKNKLNDRAYKGLLNYSICISFVDKPHENERIYLAQIKDITEKKLIEKQKPEKAGKEVKEVYTMAMVKDIKKDYVKKSVFRNIITREKKMKSVLESLPPAAQSNANTLITGESGTGKELIAHSLHELGPRNSKPFVTVNCNALPDNLLESELFGYKAGAFTDARKNKPGKFELANKGTIFLDEIGDISPRIQGKLLRVIDQKKIQALGDVKETRVDVRIITATNKDLKRMIRSGQFREDLYYRISVLAIDLPPLRERRVDIPLLCNHFIKKCNMRYNKNILGVSDSVLHWFLSYDFSGNIRELENVIEHSCVYCQTSYIEFSHLPKSILKNKLFKKIIKKEKIEKINQLQNRHIQDVLIVTKGNKTKAAKELGIHKTTLLRRMKKMNLELNI